MFAFNSQSLLPDLIGKLSVGLSVENNHFGKRVREKRKQSILGIAYLQQTHIPTIILT
jgi:hypothetical protein